jgi:hypothetical protein
MVVIYIPASRKSSFKNTMIALTGMELFDCSGDPDARGEPFQKVKAYDKALADADEEMSKWLEQTYRARGSK